MDPVRVRRCFVTISAAVLLASCAKGGRNPINDYDRLADSILDARRQEVAIVRRILASTHDSAATTHQRAQAAIKAGNQTGAAAEIENLTMLVAHLGTEGDASVARVRKRLVEGGHHFNPILGPGAAAHGTDAHHADGQKPAHHAEGQKPAHHAEGEKPGHTAQDDAHHHAGGAALGYDPGFVVISRATKKTLVETSRSIAKLAAAPNADGLAAEWAKVELVWAEIVKGAE